MLSAHALEIELPRGWSGRMFSRSPGAATLHAANYAIAVDDGQFGDRSTARMAPGAIFIALTEYLPGGELQPDRGLYSRRGLDLPLDPARFSARALAHPRPGQVGAQQFCTLAGRPFCLYVVAAGDRRQRRQVLTHADHVLRTLRVRPRAR